MKANAQFFYDLRELSGYVSGQELAEQFREATRMSPEKYKLTRQPGWPLENEEVRPGDPAPKGDQIVEMVHPYYFTGCAWYPFEIADLIRFTKEYSGIDISDLFLGVDPRIKNWEFYPDLERRVAAGVHRKHCAAFGEETPKGAYYYADWKAGFGIVYANDSLNTEVPKRYFENLKELREFLEEKNPGTVFFFSGERPV